MTGNSGRFNDIQHVQPKTHKKTPTTKEFTAWQTKTTGINENQRPRPLVCVLHSFSGVQWWLVLESTLEALQKMEEFKDMDYLLPAPTRDRTGFLPRPCSNNQALRWLRQLRAIYGTNEEDLKRLTLPSSRQSILCTCTSLLKKSSREMYNYTRLTVWKKIMGW